MEKPDRVVPLHPGETHAERLVRLRAEAAAADRHVVAEAVDRLNGLALWIEGVGPYMAKPGHRDELARLKDVMIAAARRMESLEHRA